MDLRLTNDNLRDTLDEDILGRVSEIKKFIKILDQCEKNMVFAVNGAWGCGKTFFINHVCLILDFYYIGEQGRADDKEYGKTAAVVARNKELNGLELKQKFITIYYDAWNYDAHDDPLLSLIYVLQKKYKDIGGGIYGKEGDGFDKSFKQLRPLVDKGLCLADLEKSEEIKKGFRELLGELLKVKLNNGSDGKIVIVIDELDRCRPDYAVKVLERMKHFVDCDNVFFVYCLNKVEMCKSIECCYGSGMESTIYLNKFFDVTYDLNVKRVSDYFLQKTGGQRNKEGFNRVALGMVDYLNLSLRECNQYAEVMKDFLLVNEQNEQKKILKKIFYPIMFGLRITDAAKGRDFISGKGKGYLADIVANVREVQDELGGSPGRQPSKIDIRRKRKYLENMYDDFFGKNCERDGEVMKMRDELHGLL